MRRLSRGLVIGACLASGLACITFRGPEDLRRDLARANGARLDRQTGVTIGRFGMMLAHWFTAEDDVSLEGVRKVQVGVYRVLEPAGESPGRLPELPGWRSAVRVHEDGEDVHVLLRQDGEQVHGLLVVVMDRDEWVLVRVRGRLQRIVEEAMRMAFDRTERPELYGPAVADYRRSGLSEPSEAAPAS